MTFQDAAAAQYRLHSYYTVHLVKPCGETVPLGYTQRKTGTGLLVFVTGKAVQEALKTHVPGIEGVTIVKKTKAALLLSNGWRIEFGGTIRQEAN